MRAPFVAFALALALVVGPAVAAGAEPLPHPEAPATAPEDLFVTRDPDGGRTLKLLLEDHVGGAYGYTRVDLSNTHETAGAIVSILNRPAGDAVRNTPEPIREAGAYTQTWTHRGSPMATVGVYAVHDTEGMLRAPLVVLENASEGLVAIAVGLVLDDALDMTTHAIPMLLEYALPELTAGMETWPAGVGSVDSFRDYPTVYAWTVRRSSAAGEAWEGAYLARTGSWSGGFSSTSTFDGVKDVEVGVALRLDRETTRLAGTFIESRLEKTPGDPQTARHRLTAGAAGAAGRAPLVAVEAADHRAGGERFVWPEEQRTGLVVGAHDADGAFVPLLGTWTEATHARGQGEDVEQTRLTSAGAYVEGRYAPLLGMRYHGDRSPLANWALRFAAGGTLGSDAMGDWEVDVGTFAEDEFVPLAGATYADDFADALFRYQTMVTAGVHGPLGYQPLVAATYDGERTFLTWALAWSGGRRADTEDWVVASGTFLLDRYAPIVGARFDDDSPGATRAYREHYTVGAFLLDYRLFVPLAGLGYDGEAHTVGWASSFALGGTLGSRSGAFDARGGAYVLGAYKPVVETRYRDAPTADWPSRSEITVGTRGPDGAFVPLAGATYGSTVPLVASLGSATNPKDDRRSVVTAGVYVAGGYVPVVGVENRGDRVSVGVLPPST